MQVRVSRLVTWLSMSFDTLVLLTKGSSRVEVEGLNRKKRFRNEIEHQRKIHKFPAVWLHPKVCIIS